MSHFKNQAIGNIQTENENDGDLNDDISNNEVNEDDESDIDDENTNKPPNDVTITLDNIYNQLEIIRQVDHHKSIAEKQRKFYNEITQKSDHLYNTNSIILEFDFKQKIVFGKLIKTFNIIYEF